MWVTQSCTTLWDPIDYSPQSSPVHRILQAGILEWVSIPFFGKSSWPSELPEITKSQTWMSTKTFNFTYFTLSRLELSFVFYLCQSSLTFLTDFWRPDFPGYPSWVIFPSSSLMPWASNWIANNNNSSYLCSYLSFLFTEIILYSINYAVFIFVSSAPRILSVTHGLY